MKIQLYNFHMTFKIKPVANLINKAKVQKTLLMACEKLLNILNNLCNKCNQMKVAQNKNW